MAGLSYHNLNKKIIKTQSERLAFSVIDDTDDEETLIPLFRVEEEEYTVYLDGVTGNAAVDRRVSFPIIGKFSGGCVTGLLN